MLNRSRRKQWRRVALAIALIMLNMAITLPNRVYAQAPTCFDPLFPQYSQRWRVHSGTINGNNVTTNDLKLNAIYVEYLIPDAQFVTSIQLFTFMDVFSSGSGKELQLSLEDSSGNTVDFISSHSATFGAWEGLNHAFDPAPQIGRPISSIKIFLSQSLLAMNDAHGAGLHVSQLCLMPQGDQVTPTATVFSNPSITPSLEFTNTPLPTNTPSQTPTPTKTKTPTRTHTPTWTPGGPTKTPSPTKTLLPSFTPSQTRTRPSTQTPGPSPTNTITPTRTATGFVASSTPYPSNTPGGPTETSFATVASGNSTLSASNFNTIVPPKGCSDVSNPCGALPAVPRLPTFNLASPQPITAVALASSATVQPFGTSGTTTGTPGATSTALGDQISTMAYGYKNQVSTLAAQPTGEFIIDGTPQSVGGLTTTFSENAGTFISYVKGIGLIARNRTMQLVLFFVLIIVFIILIELLIFFLPVIIKIIEFVIQLIQLIPFV